MLADALPSVAILLEAKRDPDRLTVPRLLRLFPFLSVSCFPGNAIFTPPFGLLP